MAFLIGDIIAYGQYLSVLRPDEGIKIWKLIARKYRGAVNKALTTYPLQARNAESFGAAGSARLHVLRPTPSAT